jgi:predicted phage tail protein
VHLAVGGHDPERRTGYEVVVDALWTYCSIWSPAGVAAIAAGAITTMAAMI